VNQKSLTILRIPEKKRKRKTDKILFREGFRLRGKSKDRAKFEKETRYQVRKPDPEKSNQKKRSKKPI